MLEKKKNENNKENAFKLHTRINDIDINYIQIWLVNIIFIISNMAKINMRGRRWSDAVVSK